ncbi:MAG: glycosyltransferase family 4 protein [Flavobacteriales bacterium]|nr:glycosyltransferase family 4 protein [Flavobacteriales bacterium]
MKSRIAIIDSLGAHGSSHHFYLFGQVKGLSECGVHVSLYTNNVTENPNYNGVNFYSFYKNLFGRRSKILAGIRYIFGSICSVVHARFSGVKICHYHLFHVNILVLFDFILSKILGMKVVYTIHDIVSFENEKSNKKWNKWLYKRADKILTHNHFSEKIFSENYTDLKNKIDIIPHGNYVPFLEAKTDKSFSRTYLSIPQDKKVLLFFGMIKKVKGLEVLLQSLRNVIDQNPDSLLVIAGRVWKNDFSLYQKIIDENNLSNHCLIHDKFIPHDDVGHYYASADLIVLPYKRIYQSGVLMMSLSYEKAVLVSDLPPHTEVIVDKETGFVFKTESPKSLSEKLNSILSDVDNLEKIRKKGAELIKTKYDWTEIGILTKKSYQSIL